MLDYKKVILNCLSIQLKKKKKKQPRFAHYRRAMEKRGAFQIKVATQTPPVAMEPVLTRLLKTDRLRTAQASWGE